jgi:hypothetical protein
MEEEASPEEATPVADLQSTPGREESNNGPFQGQTLPTSPSTPSAGPAPGVTVRVPPRAAAPPQEEVADAERTPAYPQLRLLSQQSKMLRKNGSRKGDILFHGPPNHKDTVFLWRPEYGLISATNGGNKLLFFRPQYTYDELCTLNSTLNDRKRPQWHADWKNGTYQKLAKDLDDRVKAQGVAPDATSAP